MKNLIILIPGNPSVPGVYRPFLNQVVQDLNLPGKNISKILSHLGQCNQKQVNQKISVFDVIEDHQKSVRRLIKTHNPDKVYLFGHSLGSAVTIDLYDKFYHIVDQFIIICPFIGPSKNNLNYLKMFKNPITRFGIKKISQSLLLNKKISRHLFKTWLGENPFNEHIPREIKKSDYIKNFLSLLSTYIDDFEQLKIEDKIKKMDPKKSFFLFAQNDYWVPDEVLSYLPIESNFKQCHQISHDFCLKEDQYKIVSLTISQYLQVIIPNS
jgi:pimeloyl-ACP methyl ester carboxylesterase